MIYSKVSATSVTKQVENKPKFTTTPRKVVEDTKTKEKARSKKKVEDTTEQSAE